MQLMAYWGRLNGIALIVVPVKIIWKGPTSFLNTSIVQ